MVNEKGKTKGKGNMVELAFKEYEKSKSKKIVEKNICNECGNDDVFRIFHVDGVDGTGRYIK